MRDNTPRPPSVLVAELLDTLLPAATATGTDPTATRGRLVIEHPLQPFSLDAFRIDGDPRLRSHREEIAAALRQSLQAAPTAVGAPVTDGDDREDDDDVFDDPLPAFFVQPLPAPDATAQQLTLAHLIGFFRHPSQALLRRRLGLTLWQDDPTLDDDEPFTPDSRMARLLAARLLPQALAGAHVDALRPLALAGTEWPGGSLGGQALQAELEDLEVFAAQVRSASAEPVLPAVNVTLGFDLDGQAWQLQAAWPDLRAGGLVRWRAGPAYASDRIEGWLQHLALCAAAPAGAARRTRWLLRDGTLAWRAVDDPRALLADLLRLYRRGLCEPLRFFPRSAWELVTQGAGAARNAWTPSRWSAHAEGNDAAHRLAWRGRGDPLGGDFERLARQVFGPLQDHLEDA